MYDIILNACARLQAPMEPLALLDGLRMILNQNRESITSLEFVNCKISLASLEAIFDTIHTEATKAHGVKHFSVKASRLSEANSDLCLQSSFPFFRQGTSFTLLRSLESLSLCEDHIGKNFAKLTFMALLDASSGLSTLELSDNNVSQHGHPQYYYILELS
ncbi:putative pectinesterase 49 [Bienertia sinuspersici]